MAGKQVDQVANVADPRWILDEDSGKLTYESLRYVQSHPTQTLMVNHTTEECSAEMRARYQRIMDDKQRRA
jgi:hypothetical protein